MCQLRMIQASASVPVPERSPLFDT